MQTNNSTLASKYKLAENETAEGSTSQFNTFTQILCQLWLTECLPVCSPVSLCAR